MTVICGLQPRDCPVCGRSERDAEPFLAASIDPARMGSFSFASRKQPEYMSYRLVRCVECRAIFAAEAPDAAALAQAYESADYDTAEEAVFAARTYARVLAPTLMRHDLRGAALEIGTGTGVFLREMQGLGFKTTTGIEPSIRAIAAADPDMRPLIREGIFDADSHAPDSLSLICCFQTLEHVADPRHLTQVAFDMLEPGGQIAFITHDHSAPLNRALGKRSPIIDVEHMQLFCPTVLRHLLSSCGFEGIEIERIRNTYPLRYWLRLVPVPNALKRRLIAAADAVGLGHRAVSIDVGNLLTVARKPARAATAAQLAKAAA